jgi:beta-galactosidase/beta-glucuronidase
MKRTLFAISIFVLASALHAQWQPAGDKIKSRWANDVNPQNVLPEYPRPILQRTDWKNLNGLWQYAIRPKGQAAPATFDGDILVPFAVESSLSGVQKIVGGENELWYNRCFTVPAAWKNKRIMLNFGAVDWQAEVFLNGIKIGSHKGGYTPFGFDVTPFLRQGEQELTVKVWDPTDRGYQPRGKQVSKPSGIWYTAVTGIWQTVWLEPVEEKHIDAIKTVSDIDKKTVTVSINANNAASYDVAEVSLLAKGKVVASAKSVIGEAIELYVAEPQLWSPDQPFLYDLEVSLVSGGKTTDRVKSYCAMRKISTRRDANGIVRLQLNNSDQFQFGPLDQGWWPDGLYTAPTDEALAFDIAKTKELGFNMIRKHVKVEPARWYYHCDRLGILVWQDMPSGGEGGPQWQTNKYFTGQEWVRNPESEKNYFREWGEIMNLLASNPSVVVWVPFNEAWGQFKTPEVVEWTKQNDPSRLVNPASGGNHYHTGDMLDLHNYPHPSLYLYDAERPTVLGEYGGLGIPMDGHLWQADHNWGYVKFSSTREVTDEYLKFAESLKKLIAAGFSAAVYTQTTDVECEVNGLMTYDRAEIKLEPERIAKVNREICNSLKK